MPRVISPRNNLVLPGGYKKPGNPVLDASDPISRGLVGFWPLGDAVSGITKDISGCGPGGTFVNGPMAFSSAAHGGMATSLAAASTQIITPPNVNIDATFTLSLWVYLNSTATMCPIAQAKSDLTVSTFFLRLNANSGFSNGLFNFIQISTASPSINTWHHVVLINDGYTLFYYVDGVLITSGTGGLSVDGSAACGPGSLALGQRGGFASDPYDGRLDCVRVYKRALSSSEVKRLYTEPYAGTFAANANLIGSSAVDATVNLAGVSGTAAAGTLSTNAALDFNLSGVSATAAAGTLGSTYSASLTLTGAATTAAAGSLAVGVGHTVDLVGASATAAIGSLTLTATSTVALVGVAATAYAGILPPTQVLVTVPILTIMNDNPVPAEGDMVGDYIPMEEDMPNQIALETVLNTFPIPMTGTLSAVPIPAEGSVP